MKLDLLLAVKQGLLTPDQDLVWLEIDRPGKSDWLAEQLLFGDRGHIEALGVSYDLFHRIWHELKALSSLSLRYRKPKETL